MENGALVQQPNGPAFFPRREDLGPREWGEETLLFVIPGEVMMKRIRMKAGAKGGLQYHRCRDEGGVILEGRALVRFDEGEGLVEMECEPGDVFVFPQGAVHQIEALTDCVYIEASTPFLNDRVHVEHLYGLEEAGGLPSTEPEDVVAL